MAENNVDLMKVGGLVKDWDVNGIVYIVIEI